jgi:hypothetical protein
MDYENVKAIIEARLKQFEAEPAAFDNEHWPPTISVDFASKQIAIRTCELILQDLATAHDIYQAQVR